jgi:hypothetical protein
MSEDEKLIVKWLESPDGEEWSRLAHTPLYGSLVSIVPDGVPSDIIGVNLTYKLWVAQ